MFNLNQDPGSGNLNLRAYVASLVGPRRVIHGQPRVIRAPLASTGQSVEVAKSTNTGKQATYYEVWLPRSVITTLPGNGAVIAFGSGVIGGSESAYQFLITGTQRLTGVLLDDDALYATALTDATGGVLAAPVSLVVATVVF